jgi:hypothetical protein
MRGRQTTYTPKGVKMTDVDLHETLNGYRGAIGKLVFRRFKGRIIVSRKGTISKPPTEAQKAQRAHFKQAVAFGKAAMTDPVLSAFYGPLARQKETSIYALAQQDFLKGPTIEPLDLSGYKGQVGDVIEIRAIDNVCLADLNVKIVAQDGTPIENGKAVETGDRSGRWNYILTKPVSLGTDIFIEVKAVDHAGNEAQITENPTVGGHA